MEYFAGIIGDLQKKLGFVWRNPELLRIALVHSSFTYEHRELEGNSNERLEFLGDAVLELIISDYYYNHCHNKTEGELTKMRALTVCEPSLAEVARRLELGRYMFMGRGEERSGGRERSALLADSFEALLGAVYLDGGLEEARRVTLQQLAKIIEEVESGNASSDYKTELQEILQRRSTDPIHYSIVHEEGPDHDKTFTAVVEYQKEILGSGRGRTKKEAEQQAAKMALTIIR